MFQWLQKKWARNSGSQGWGLGIPNTSTTSGQNVNHSSANTLSAFYAAIRNIAEDIGKLPCPVMRIDANQNREPARDISTHRLLNLRPNPMMTAMGFKELLTSWALGWGNGFAEIVFNVGMQPVEVWPIHPARVTPQVDQDGKLFYWVYPDYDIRHGDIIQLGTPVLIPDWQMIHVKGPSDFGIWGRSVIECMAESLGLSLAAQKFGGAFFGNGANPSGVLTHPNQVSEEGATRIKKSLERSFRGADNSGGTLVLEEGMKFEPVTINPRDAQALELRQFQVEEVARWFRIQPHKLQDLSHATYSNIESQNLDYVTDTLLSWTKRWEEEIEVKLLLEDPTLTINFNFNFLLKGDRAARAAYYNTMHFMGAINVNEIRKYEDMNSIGERGDEYYQQSAMVPLGTSFDGMVESAAEAVTRKEIKACANEQKKERDHTEWAEDFWTAQINYAVTSFSPIVTTMGQLKALDPVQTLEALSLNLAAHYKGRQLEPTTTTELMEIFDASKRQA